MNAEGGSRFLKALVSVYQTAQHYIPQDGNHNIHIKFHKLFLHRKCEIHMKQ
jgi:hypothetical protein